jgi:ferric iron reductase protein FhuF
MMGGNAAADRSPELAGVLDTVGGHLSYLRSSTSAPADDGWISCGDLSAGGPLLRDLLTTTGAGRGTHDEQVAASLFVQGYAFRVGAIPLIAYALALPVPDCLPRNTAIQIGRHRPNNVAFLSPTLHPPDAAPLKADLVDQHLAPFIDAVRATVTVGERLLWGNVAASFAVAFRAIEGVLDDPAAKQRIRDRALALYDTASPRLDGLGTFVTLRGTHRDGWFFERTNCCLWYQASGGQYCDDCSLLDPAERTAAWQAQLDSPPDD